MKILIELPTWLGDAVMATPAIENITKNFNEVELTLIGSFVSIQALKNNPKVTKTYTLNKNIISLFKVLNSLEEFDLFFSFRGSLRARFMKLLISSKTKYQFDKKTYLDIHQVEKYNNFVNDSLLINSQAGGLRIHYEIKNKDKTIRKVGINPGAAYGNSKQWYPKNFASVAKKLSTKYEVIIFGGPGEIEIAKDIENDLLKNGVKNFHNLAGALSIDELTNHISSLDLFITGDSGPMHLAAALKVPTVAIFGSTNDIETSQWKNPKNIIVKKNLECQPCMKRSCPLKHHNCMKMISSEDVIDAAETLVQFSNSMSIK